MTDADDKAREIREWAEANGVAIPARPAGRRKDSAGPLAASEHPIAAPPSEPIAVELLIELTGARPRIWRRVRLRGDLTMAQFHAVIQAAMGWSDSHLHRFHLDASRRGGHVLTADDVAEFDTEGGVGLEDEIRVDQLLHSAGDRVYYDYDFGDDWRHTITVETVVPGQAFDGDAICIAGRRACPLEDCGGTGGHAQIVELIADDPSRATWPEELAEWVPADYDPDLFDPSVATAAIRWSLMSPGEILDQIATSRAPLEPGDRRFLMSEAMAELLGRLDGTPLQDEALARLTELIESTDEPLPDDELREALVPFQWVLDRACDGGLELTGAGYLRPVAVAELAAVLPTMRDWIFPINRENNSMPVLEFREFMQGSPLLRKHKGTLLASRLGRTAQGDPDRLWEVLAGCIVPSEPAFERLATTAVMLWWATSDSDEHIRQIVAAAMTAAGWSERGTGEVSESSIRWLINGLWPVLGALGAAGRKDRRLSPAARRLVRDALVQVVEVG